MIYFIQEGEDGPIKIGYTKSSPEKRMATLQTGNPVELRLIESIPGDRKAEKKLHVKFVEHRLEGEWFDPSPIKRYLNKDVQNEGVTWWTGLSF